MVTPSEHRSSEADYVERLSRNLMFSSDSSDQRINRIFSHTINDDQEEDFTQTLDIKDKKPVRVQEYVFDLDE